MNECYARKKDWNVAKQKWEDSDISCGALKDVEFDKIFKKNECGTNMCPFFTPLRELEEPTW